MPGETLAGRQMQPSEGWTKQRKDAVKRFANEWFQERTHMCAFGHFPNFMIILEQENANPLRIKFSYNQHIWNHRREGEE